MAAADTGPHPHAMLLRRRRRLRWTIIVAAAVLVVVSAIDHLGFVHHTGFLRPLGLPGYSGDDHARFDRQRFSVARVVDGDTLELQSGSETVPVRLLGIDAPELHRDGRPDHWAPQARDWLKQTAEGKIVILRLEPVRTRDRYGRLLAYVYLDEQTDLSHLAVKLGHAYADRRFNHTMRSLFEQSEAQAQRRALGLWQAVTPEQMPPWCQQWLGERKSAR